jgi:hypothetical protein
MYVIFAPAMVLCAGCSIVYENTIGVLTMKWEKWHTERSYFENELSLIACIKNEGPYIGEWIEYHKAVGVTKFYIYDNDSTDHVKDILNKYINTGEVEYYHIHGNGKQLDAYYDGLCKCRNKTKYAAFIDLDEFIVPVRENTTIQESVAQIMQLDKEAGGIAVNWYVYGSSGYKEKPEGSVTGSYLYRADEKAEVNKCIKTICNPRLIKGFLHSPHYPVYRNRRTYSINENGKVIKGSLNPFPDNSYEKMRINHYYCKSEAECRAKFSRGLADDDNHEKRKWDQFVRFDRNEIYDDIMMRYQKELV